MNLTSLATRSTVGGVFMGLANLVPGISGGTMLLAAGIYPQFIQAIANVTSFKFKKDDILTLIFVGGAAVLSILLCAGAVKELVLEYRWVMYSLFIGLTLGGVPILLSLLGKVEKSLYIFVGIGLLGMLALAYSQVMQLGAEGEQVTSNVALLLVAGAAGASAMILPGVSGGYLLLVLGCYIPILNGIDQLKMAVKARDLAAIWIPMQEVVIPVGIGVGVGVVLVSHILRWCLKRYERQTYAILLGLLLGAIFGLWPFKRQIPLVEIESIKGQTVEVINGELTYQVSGKLVKIKDIPMIMDWPDASSLALSLLIVVLGFAVTLGISKVGNSRNQEQESQPQGDTP